MSVDGVTAFEYHDLDLNRMCSTGFYLPLTSKQSSSCLSQIYKVIKFDEDVWELPSNVIRNYFTCTWAVDC